MSHNSGSAATNSVIANDKSVLEMENIWLLNCFCSISYSLGDCLNCNQLISRVQIS